jgi:2-polyprenyl-3-methyl-5-hydroxy-6-metoxy-1,4-benzoquinol methylase
MSTPDTHAWPTNAGEVERLNDQLAREHPINDYYAQSPWFIRFIQDQRLSLIRKWVGTEPGLRILEVGAGGGHVLKLFPKGKLTAVDVSDVYLETARRNLAGYDVTFLKGQVETLDLPPGEFDRIICTEVLEHTTNPGEILAALKRLLSPRGKAVITVPIDPVIDTAKQVIRRTPVGWVLGNRVNWGGDHYHLQKWWPWQFRKLLEQHFTVDESRIVPLPIAPLHACFLCRI